MFPSRLTSARRRASWRCWRMPQHFFVVDVSLRGDEGLVVRDLDVLEIRDDITAGLRRVTIDHEADELQVRHARGIQGVPPELAVPARR